MKTRNGFQIVNVYRPKIDSESSWLEQDWLEVDEVPVYNLDNLETKLGSYCNNCGNILSIVSLSDTHKLERIAAAANSDGFDDCDDDIPF